MSQRLAGEDAAATSRRSHRFAALAILGVALVAAGAEAQNIDEFESPFVAIPNVAQTAVALPGTSMLGLEFDYVLDNLSAPAPMAFAAHTNPFLNQLVHLQAPGAFARSRFHWDGADGDPMAVDPTGLGNLDFTVGTTRDALQLRFLEVSTPTDVPIRFFSGAGSDDLTLSIPAPLGSGTIFKIPFRDFVLLSGGGADYSQIGALELEIDGSTTPGLLVRLDSVRVAKLVEGTKTDSLVVDLNNDGMVNPGDTVRYTVEVLNDPDAYQATALAVVYSSNVDPATDLVVGSVTTSMGTVTTGNGGGDTNVVVAIGDLADAAVATITYDVMVRAPVAAGLDQIVCQGRIDTSDLLNLPTDDPDTVVIEDATVTPVVADPAASASLVDTLLVDLDGDNRADPGDTLRYTAVVTSSGDEDAADALYEDGPVVSTQLVAGSVTTSQGTVLSGNGGGDTAVAVQLGGIPGAGGNATVTYDVVIDAPLPPSVDEIAAQGDLSGSNFIASVSDDPAAAGSADPTTTAVDTPAPYGDKTVFVLIDADQSGSATEGDTLEYRVELGNLGGTALVGVSYRDAPDANADVVAGTVVTSQGTVVLGNGVGDPFLLVDVGDIDPGDTVTVTYSVEVPDALPQGVDSLTNQGQIQSQNAPPGITDDPGTPVSDDPTVVGVGPRAILSIPSLGTWGMIGLTLLLGAAAFSRLARAR